MAEKPQIRNTDEARQGETSGRMRWVLLISTVVAVVILAAIAFLWRH